MTRAIRSGKPVTEKDLNLVKGLSQRDRLYLIQVYQLIEGNVDTDIEVECKRSDCLYKYSFPLDLGQLFSSSQDEKPNIEDIIWE